MRTTIQTYSSILIALMLLVFSTGCDSDSGGDDDNGGSGVAEAFVGNWGLGGISDGNGDRTVTFAAEFNSVVLVFSANNNITLSVDAVDDSRDAAFSGTYSLNESASTLLVTLDVAGTPTPLTFAFEVVNDNTIRLTATGTTGILLGVLFGESLADPVVITLVSA